jgi:hypothetical protein
MRLDFKKTEIVFRERFGRAVRKASCKACLAGTGQAGHHDEAMQWNDRAGHPSSGGEVEDRLGKQLRFELGRNLDGSPEGVEAFVGQVPSPVDPLGKFDIARECAEMSCHVNLRFLRDPAADLPIPEAEIGRINPIRNSTLHDNCPFPADLLVTITRFGMIASKFAGM